MESFESWHDADEFGPLLSMDGELVSVSDLVRRQMLAPLPLVPAVDLVLDAIEQDGSTSGYLTSRGNFAIKIRDVEVWPDSLIPASPVVFGHKRPGTLGVMDYLRGHWRLKSRPKHLYDPLLVSGYQFAILRKDADRIFGREPSGFADVDVAVPTPAPSASAPAVAPPEPVVAPAEAVTVLGAGRRRAPTVHELIAPFIARVLADHPEWTAKQIHSEMCRAARERTYGLQMSRAGELVCSAAGRAFGLPAIEKAKTAHRKNRGSTVEPPSNR